MTEVEEAPVTERTKVVDWRLAVLLDAGYSQELAERIAESTADLHVACQLLDEGCPPRLAADILI